MLHILLLCFLSFGLSISFLHLTLDLSESYLKLTVYVHLHNFFLFFTLVIWNDVLCF